MHTGLSARCSPHRCSFHRDRCARIGVRHADPAHHFGDEAGLLTAYAIQGLAALRQRLAVSGAEAAAAGEPALLAMGPAYVRFAVDVRALHADVRAQGNSTAIGRTTSRHANDAFDVLMDAVRGLRTASDPTTPTSCAPPAGAWSLVHGSPPCG